MVIITCKNEGEILYSCEYNFELPLLYGVLRREMNNLNIFYTKSIIPYTKTLIDSDVMTDSSGYKNRIIVADTTATYNGSGLTGFYYSDSNGCVYTCCKDYGEPINYVYATADVSLTTGTCVTYDILKASDCSELSTDNELNTFADICACNECNIIVRYKLCSDTGCCSCIKKFAYTIIK